MGTLAVYSGRHFVAAGEKFMISCTLHMNRFLQWTINGRPIVPGEAG